MEELLEKLVRECIPFTQEGKAASYIPELSKANTNSLGIYIVSSEGIQRIARRDKKAFLNDQCKEIEENNRMGKTRDLFKKIRDTKGTFHAKMGTIKDRNYMDLTEANVIKKRWQGYIEELYKMKTITMV